MPFTQTTPSGAVILPATGRWRPKSSSQLVISYIFRYDLVEPAYPCYRSGGC